jgi:hypothetical protein
MVMKDIKIIRRSKAFQNVPKLEVGWFGNKPSGNPAGNISKQPL